MKIDLEPQDVQAIADRAIEGLKPLLTQKTNHQDDLIFDVPGLCEYLHVTPKWVHERTHLKEIPFIKLSNKQLRFRKKKIDKWVESHEISAINPLSSKIRLVR